MQFRSFIKTRTGKIIASLLGLGVLLALIVSLLWGTNVFGWRKWRINEVQQFIGIEMPTDAQNIQFATETKKTRIVWLRFTLASETEIDGFLAQLGFEAALREGFTPFPAQNPAEAALSWWTPQAAQGYSGFNDIHNSKVYDLLIDQTDNANPIVFLRVYSIRMG